MVLTVSFAISLVSRAFFATIAGVDCASILANLTPASGRQDHATSPSASFSLVSRNNASIASRGPTFVTIAKRPS
jgi:hypothetical protein